MEEYEKIITDLKAKIKSRDHDIHLAATYGKQLYEDNINLSKKLEHLAHEKEELEQEKHSLQLELEARVQTVNTQNIELENQRDQADDFQQKLRISEKENDVLNKKNQNLAKENQYIEKVQDDLRLENKSLKDKINSLEKQIQNFQDVAEKSLLEMENGETQQLQAQLNTYKLNNGELQDMLSKMQHDLEVEKKNEIHLMQMVKDLEEGIIDRDSEISAYSSEVNKYKEDIEELQAEIEILKFDQLDPKRRGNSVFAELDDRRTMVETEYKLLKRKFEYFKKNYEINKQDLDQYRSSLAILQNNVTREYQQTYIDKLDDALSSARKEISELTHKLSKAQENRIETNFEELKLSKNNEYDYLRVMLTQLQRKVKELQNEIMDLRIKNISVTDKLVETERMLYATKEDLYSAEQEITKLKLALKDAVENDVPNKYIGKETQKPLVEVIDQSKPLSSSIKSVRKELNPVLDSMIIPGELELFEDGFQQVKPPRKSNRFVLQTFNKVDDESEDNGKNNKNWCEIPCAEEDAIKNSNCGKENMKLTHETEISDVKPCNKYMSIKDSTDLKNTSIENQKFKQSYSEFSSRKKHDYCAQQ